MGFPRGRELILGIGAGIAAYKSCELLRRLLDNGFLVTVVPTPNSLNFVGSATWQALSHRPVYSQVWENIPDVPHIALGEKAHLILIAPATADLMARIAHGRADDLLTNTVLSSAAPILMIPAMHPKMWLNPATVENVKTLRDRGIFIMEPSIGRLTGSDVGVGRFPETQEIIDFIEESYGYRSDLLGKKVVITGGGTREPIDPVRYIGNRSSGKQGYALAYNAAMRGAEVILIQAATTTPAIEGIRTIEIESASNLFDAMKEHTEGADLVIMSAAVSDAKPSLVAKTKIKKGDLGSIALEENPDLIAEFTRMRREKGINQVIVGFAAETTSSYDDLITLGKQKLVRKDLDLIYVNSVEDGAIFAEENTEGAIILRSGSVFKIENMSKYEMAEILINKALERIPNV
ncbi:MAG: bifunctional phosphopantothenoylcysteine decarboxylase/phosphopantothenate--cysteine ligase CoaBC [Actinomycetota bacterium]|nr:bifunctional phosphopantothenoylcysteine decarboxylase/phosphopantothenate--cysteine ligase CoaBC [Actinomycetota bacterium]